MNGMNGGRADICNQYISGNVSILNCTSNVTMPEQKNNFTSFNNINNTANSDTNGDIPGFNRIQYVKSEQTINNGLDYKFYMSNR